MQEEERRLRDEHIAYQQQQAKVQRERQEDLLMREAKAKKEVMKVMRAKRKCLQQREVSKVAKIFVCSKVQLFWSPCQSGKEILYLRLEVSS